MYSYTRVSVPSIKCGHIEILTEETESQPEDTKLSCSWGRSQFNWSDCVRPSRPSVSVRSEQDLHHFILLHDLLKIVFVSISGYFHKLTTLISLNVYGVFVQRTFLKLWTFSTLLFLFYIKFETLTSKNIEAFVSGKFAALITFFCKFPFQSEKIFL